MVLIYLLTTPCRLSFSSFSVGSQQQVFGSGRLAVRKEGKFFFYTSFPSLERPDTRVNLHVGKRKFLFNNG